VAKRPSIVTDGYAKVESGERGRAVEAAWT
jgi:hypothetical protein